MRRNVFGFALTLVAILAAVAAQEHLAIADLRPAANQTVSGRLVLQQIACFSAVIITGTITGLTPGKHGIHLHQYGDVSDSCKFCGPHFDLMSMAHGGPLTPVRHTGDYGNIEADSTGSATVNIVHDGITLCAADNTRCVLGRSLVVHQKEDDLGFGEPGSQTNVTGNSGARVACGSIILTLEPPPACAHCPA